MLVLSRIRTMLVVVGFFTKPGNFISLDLAACRNIENVMSYRRNAI